MYYSTSTFFRVPGTMLMFMTDYAGKYNYHDYLKFIVEMDHKIHLNCYFTSLYWHHLKKITNKLYLKVNNSIAVLEYDFGYKRPNKVVCRYFLSILI